MESRITIKQMLNIVVIIYDILNSYNYAVLNGIYNYFEKKDDVRLIIAPVNIPHAENINSDYQYWSTVKLLESKCIDGIILVPNSFTNYIAFEKLTEELKAFSGKPLVSISRLIELKNSKYTFNTCDCAYEMVIEHLKNKHHRKRIAFFDASLANSPESEARFEAFKKALKKYDLPFYPELVFHGDFTPGKAEQVIAEKVKSKDDLNFDAICCVNDFTCGGCIYHFEKIGVKVPDDVVLVGYDDSNYASKTFPRLSSINQAIPFTGEKGAELLYKTLKGESNQISVCTDSFPVYRQSCGCIDCNTTYSTAYYDYKGNYFERDEKKYQAEESSIKRQQQILTEVYNMITLMDCKTPLELVMDALKPAMSISNLSQILVCLYDNPLEIEQKDNIKIPPKAKIQIEYDVEKGNSKIFPLGKGDEIILSESLLSENEDFYRNGQYFIHPVFVRNRNYGYLICKSDSRDYILTAISLKIISDILVNAFEYSVVLQNQQSLLEVNKNLAITAKTDELTSVLNRRGFMEYGQRLIEMSVLSNKMGSVFFCDLDGLKTINDTYGHEIGDLAIKTEAKVLQAAFRDSDLVGRLSGDEFGIVAPGLPEVKIDIIRERLKILNTEFSLEANLPFILSISIGQYSFNSNNPDLKTLLTKADKNLYKEKKEKHSKK